MSLLRMMRTIFIALLLAFGVGLAFAASSHLGGIASDLFLAPGKAVQGILPNAVIDLLDPVPEFTQHTISIAVLSFLTWWLALVLAASVLDIWARRKRA